MAVPPCREVAIKLAMAYGDLAGWREIRAHQTYRTDPTATLELPFAALAAEEATAKAWPGGRRWWMSCICDRAVWPDVVEVEIKLQGRPCAIAYHMGVDQVLNWVVKGRRGLVARDGVRIYGCCSFNPKSGTVEEQIRSELHPQRVRPFRSDVEGLAP